VEVLSDYLRSLTSSARPVWNRAHPSPQPLLFGPGPWRLPGSESRRGRFPATPRATVPHTSGSGPGAAFAFSLQRLRSEDGASARRRSPQRRGAARVPSGRRSRGEEGAPARARASGHAQPRACGGASCRSVCGWQGGGGGREGRLRPLCACSGPRGL
jgi:hypothetical protein